jgi:hypothetical protein
VLQYNDTSKPASEHAAHGAHWAHAAVVSLHMLCCGLPAAFALAGAATMGAVVLGGTLGRIHHFLHGYELWVLALSGTLVGVGAALEWRHRQAHRGFPVMFAVSVVCLFLNAGLIVSHRLFP